MREVAANPWALPAPDPVRAGPETAWLGRLLDRMFALAPGRRVLDLGCGDGLVRRLAGARAEHYLGVDLFPAPDVPALRRDLRDGLGDAAREPFDLCVGSFGVASHVEPGELRGLLRELAAAGAPGAVVALEGLGLHSLEWPGLWQAPPGPDRTLPYRLSGDVAVHPWAPRELVDLATGAGLRPFGSADRTVQFGPKLGADAGYWPGMPALRPALAALMAGDGSAREALGAPLPPLPAHPAADVHYALAGRRRAIAGDVAALLALEPPTAMGIGHGVWLLARVS